MNKTILLVMRWIDDKDSVTKEELKANAASARALSAAEIAIASAVYTAANAAVDRATSWVDRFFEATGEDRSEYYAEVVKLRTVK